MRSWNGYRRPSATIRLQGRHRPGTAIGPQYAERVPETFPADRSASDAPPAARPPVDPLDLLRRDAQAARSPSGSVASRLLDVLLGDSMRPGDRLPSERRLTEAMGVGRSAVREAIAALEVLGIVETRAGSGTYLRASTSELLPQTLSWSLMVDQDATGDLAVVRGALERSAAQEAARAPQSAQVARLRELVAAQEAAREDPRSYIEADMAFHQQLAAMAGNPILAALLSTSRSLLRVWFERGVEDPADIEVAIAEHRAVSEAIAAGDPEAAAAAMEAHMRTAAERLARTEIDGA